MIKCKWCGRLYGAGDVWEHPDTEHGFTEDRKPIVRIPTQADKRRLKAVMVEAISKALQT